MKALRSFSEWKELGLYLGLHSDMLDEIERDKRECRHCLYAMLSKWLNQQYDVHKNGLPSWSKLADEVEVFDRAQATKILEEYCGPVAKRIRRC